MWRTVLWAGILRDEANAPINSKLQHLPRAKPGHLTVHRARGGGNLNVVLEGWGIWTGLISFWRNTPVNFFGFCRGLTDLQDRISPLLVNNTFKRVFKRSLMVSVTAYLSEGRVKCLIEDELCLWGEVVQYLLVGYLNGFFAPRGGNLNKLIFKSLNARWGGGDVELPNWSANKNLKIQMTGCIYLFSFNIICSDVYIQTKAFFWITVLAL